MGTFLHTPSHNNIMKYFLGHKNQIKQIKWFVEHHFKNILPLGSPSTLHTSTFF
jgi:hypothetical protein